MNPQAATERAGGRRKIAMDINKEMEEMIKKNLPEATATTLKKYIEEAEGNKKKLTTNTELIDYNSKAILALNLELAELKNRVKTEGELVARERDVSDKENKLDVTLANLKVAEAEKRADAIYNLAGIVFKNPSFTRAISRSGVAIKSIPGGNDSHNETETVTEGIQ